MNKIFILSPFFIFVSFFIFSGCVIKSIPDETGKREEVQLKIKTVDEMEAELNASSTKESKEEVVAEETAIEKQPLYFKETESLYLKNQVKLTQDINFISLNSGKKLDEYTGRARLSKNPEDINFESSFVIVIALKPSQISKDIKVNAIFCQGTTINVSYEIVQNKNLEKGYFESETKFFVVQKPKFITSIIFKDKDDKKTIIYYGNRTQNSPSSLDDLKKNFTGEYKGTIPAASGPGINNDLVLYPNYTFVLRQVYLSNTDRVFEHSGNWAPTEDLSSFVLNYDKNISEQTRFYFINKNTIEQLDVYGEKINSDLYKLKK